MSNFGKSPAFPQSVVYDAAREQVNSSYEYGAEMGLNIQQHVWLQLLCAALACGQSTAEHAKNFADAALPLALERLEELA